MQVDYEVGIVGAGFGGIIAAHGLKRSGCNSFVILERAAQVGGVWRDNVYPGCTCDVRSNLYSLAGEPNPEWTSSYASQREILQYLKDLLARHDMKRHLRLGANVGQVRFLEHEGCWQVDVNQQESFRVRTIILATGPHSRPAMPSISGMKTFQGTSFHSTAWDHTVELAGKRVAVVGTGASAIQIVPNVAPVVSHLYVFQRTPAWVIPRHERKISQFEKRLFAGLPFTQTLIRGAVYWTTEFVGMAFMGNDTLNAVMTRVALRKIAREIHDPEVRQRMTPSYTIGCKRVLISDDFYPAFNRSNVQLVTDSIEEVTPRGIRTEDGTVHEVDHIVWATGFTVADTDNYLRVVGRGNRVLTDTWNEHGPEAYLGINVAGFPNLAILLGPNSGLGHSSALHVMESQMNYILEYLACLREAPGACLDVRPDIQQSYNEDVQRRLKRTVWAAGCKSWYLDRKGRNTTVYPGLTWQYRRLTRRFKRSSYELYVPDPVPEPAAMLSSRSSHTA